LEEIMTKVSALGGSLLAAVLAFYGPVPALAVVAAPGTAVTGTCAVLDNTCAATDTTFTPTSAKMVSSGGVTTVICSGTTKTKPAKAVKCDGEKLGGASGEDPTKALQPCSITLGSGSPALTDDWLEVISPSGNVKLICKAGGTDTN
jgi:hypothetical protein